MRLSLPDRAACQADSAPESVGGRERDLTTDNVDGHTARRWDRYYAVVDSLEESLIAVASWSWKSIGYAWTRLLDRDYPPRRWWWPAEAEVPLHHDDLQRQHGQCSETTNRLLFTLLGFCFFCWLTLGGSDAALLGAGGEVAVPVVNVSLSKTAFLTVGPIILIALTLYVHILVERLRRYDTLHADQRLPYIFNLSDPVSRLLSRFLLYWMVPLVLALFTWKAGPRPEAPLIGAVAIVATTLLLWLQMRRCPKTRRGWNIPRGVVMIALLALFPFWATGQIPLNRPLNLYQAALAKMDLSGFDLHGANLSRANLRGAFLSYTNLREATLNGVDLTGAILQGANLSKTKLSWAEGLQEATLSEVDFRDANLSWTDLSKADLGGAKLRGAVLYQTILRGANLEAADGLTSEQMASAITDATTRLPKYLQGLAEKR